MTERLTPTEFARELRKNPTDAERALWRILARLRPRFTRQYPIGPYTVDFACRRARLIVEADGGQHLDSKYDATRSAELEACGWQVLRYWDNDALANADGVVLDIIERGKERLPPGEEFKLIASRPPRHRTRK